MPAVVENVESVKDIEAAVSAPEWPRTSKAGAYRVVFAVLRRAQEMISQAVTTNAIAQSTLSVVEDASPSGAITPVIETVSQSQSQSQQQQSQQQPKIAQHMISHAWQQQSQQQQSQQQQQSLRQQLRSRRQQLRSHLQEWQHRRCIFTVTAQHITVLSLCVIAALSL